MSVRILEGTEGGNKDGVTNAVFYCSTTGWAFGPVMSSTEEAELFLKFLDPIDPRLMKDSELEGQYADFVQAFVCECGGLRDELDAEVKASDQFGQCICDDAGDCEWCKAKADAENWKPESGERFTCYQCRRKAANHGKDVSALR